MTFEELLQSMTPEIHATMKTAVELGKWADGRRLTDEEREACMQAVIAYDEQHVPEEERVGYISRKKSDGSNHSPSQSTEEIVKILQN
ncbi:DUF1315 family protein [Motiliproteus coralliicola]|uniref:DUF1315 family protein n=1 Tax=Motiliproteus coralliicola TaxID=2283196 RepID=A0A369WVV0_9GAMM|nr:DUF1315 family protein [Motiliproteus coralliicola]RDE25243.1 DUF1315 family protein [Motiliproteus coralliicola]